MPVTVTYPGVYIEEVPSAVRTITGVSTSVTGFIGRARRGPVNRATVIHSFGEFERIFGGLWGASALGYAVQHYFLNGGATAVIVRVHGSAATDAATASLDFGSGVTFAAANPGSWGNQLRGRVDHLVADPADTSTFNLSVMDLGTGAFETHRNLSTSATSPRFATQVLANQSSLLRVTALPGRPTETPAPATGATPFQNGPNGEASNAIAGTGGGDDTGALPDTAVLGSAGPPKTGLNAFDDAEDLNLLCVPPYSTADPSGDASSQVLTATLAYARARRAMLLVDSPASWNDAADPIGSSGIDSSAFGLARDANAAVYFPRVRSPDPLNEGRLATFAACGVIAGVIARTDAGRGVWKAPAGLDATLIGVNELSVALTDPENGQLNPQGINCLRTLPGAGRVVWGARTMRGSDRLADQWKYLPVRRTALYIEESLYRGTQWVVFEPNDEPLWAQIRLNVGAFMHNLFRQGAFQGATPREAYLVKCDAETTTQDDINRGVVNILVGFAPLKPAEFVIIRIQQLAGQIAS
ncbi:MAG: phage tail sheath subtilisin-like domain-containing protein [Gemmatimonadetes bacterium]|nr:phage tail sheath subtilisin-like domain-containing protein [Gemmatimonadota bacterium]